MIKTISISINEVDDEIDALAQLQSQFNKEDLLSNSVGIVNCHADFITSGVFAALCDNLPFDVVGTTSMSSSVGKEDGIILALTVLTSDDVFFSTGISEEIFTKTDGNFEKAYADAAAALPNSPSLIWSFAPFLLSVGGDSYVEIMDKVSGGVPNFGTIAVDHNDDYHESQVLRNGEAFLRNYAFVLVCGNINPSFYIANISNKSLFPEKSVVTDSVGSLLKTVNHIPIRDYMVKLGFSQNPDGSIKGISSFPFIIDFNDGTVPITRVMLAVTPEGYGVCGGDVPIGATFSIGSIDNVEVVNSTEKRIISASSDDKHNFFLIYSCLGRFYALGYDTTGEIDKITSVLGEGSSSFHFAYSGCELCPVYNSDGTTVNRCHNDTLIICAI